MSEMVSIQLEQGRVLMARDKQADKHTDQFIQASIALSLKRIADAMSETNEYGEGPAKAIGAGIARAMRESYQP